LTEIFLENVSKYFGKVKAVEDMTLKVRRKEFVVLLGPSGCGKTTTLRLIAGLEKPTKGNIYFDGHLVNELGPKDRNVAMVFQDFALYPHMTVFDNIALCLKVRKLPKDEIRRRVLDVARLLQIEDLLERKPGQLSGGQKQRVALARAIVRNPSVYLMDEPLSNLDALLRVKMRVELRKLHERLGATTIYVTHDQAEAMVMADRIVVMNRGKIVQVGTPNEIYEKPANLFVAEFVGTPPMNFIECELKNVGNETYIVTDDFQLKLPKEISTSIEANKFTGKKLVLGVRPENIAVSKKLTQDAEEIIKGKVLLIQRLSGTLYAAVDIGAHTITAFVPQGTNVSKGDEVYLRINKLKIHIFDKETKKALL